MENANSFGETLAYDLRQRYAKIVGDHLEDVANARKSNDYGAYFRALEDLYVVVKHKFKLDDKKKIKEEEEDTYTKTRQKCIDIANKNSNAWGGNSQNTEEIAEIEKALRDIEMFLYSKMDEGNMFGSKRDTEGLV